MAFNEGFLTNYAIKKILKFEAFEEEDGYELAKIFVEAGINIPQEIFVGYFKKTLNKSSFEDAV